MDDEPEPPSLNIPEIRDYQRINSEVATLLDQGHPRIRLEGAEGQRLLASGLNGAWQATIEILGRTGPELGAGLNAPGLVILARGSTADGAGRGLRAGTLVILGSAGDAAGYGQAGGLLIVDGPVGHRAGLAQSGGTLVVVGSTGRLPSDRRVGGYFFVCRGPLGPFPGRGSRGGRLIDLPESRSILDPEDAKAWDSARLSASRWIGRSISAEPGP
ncbi:glutamate synthase [Tundrisphaera lichenicola]|uniref:GltB/FmdC/FwdC-like GXGXG domain-containing protein n=1 Tax=Tundrisphaera lichenicola TaxID=2029860 RepID=UPI003EBD8931